MSQEPAGFTLPSGDFGTPPPPQKRGIPVWLMILLGVVLLLVLGCGALVALGVGFVAEQNDPVAQTATATASDAQLRADEDLIVNAELVIEEFLIAPMRSTLPPATAALRGDRRHISSHIERTIVPLGFSR
ncbi:MAG: hypothetical protein HC822_23110 [Oscillochloris sp.]|nr:hypothetical protein [Oscillochloris sp.]